MRLRGLPTIVMKKWMNPVAAAVLGAAVLTAVSGIERAQAAAQGEPRPDAGQQQDQQPVFRTGTSRVVLHATVLDGRSDVVATLPREAFKVYEDGVEQDIEFFASQEVPIAAGLVIDNSSSMVPRQGMVRAGVTSFAESGRDSDEMFTILFNEHVRFGLPGGVPFTHSAPQLLASFAARGPGGMTALHDAVIEGLSHLATAGNQKRTLVVLSDGDDNASSQSQSNMLYRASQSNAVIYTIWTGNLMPDEGNPKLLRRLAERSGGLAFTPRGEDEVVKAFSQIATNIRRGYTIGYAPKNSANDGSYRKINIVARKPGQRLTVRSRDGYTAPDDRLDAASAGGGGK
jgi:VWFA-related protein